MHVGLVVAGDIDGQSGGFYYDRRLRDRLRERGHEVTVCSLPLRSYTRQLTDTLRARRIAAQLDGVGADVLVEDGLAHPSLVAANRFVETPTVALVHMLASRAREGVARRVVRRIESWFLAGVDAAIYTSTATREGAELLGAPRAGVVAPPAGDRFTPTLSAAAIRERATAGPLAVAFLGNVVERKGLAALVAGLANIERAPDRDVDWRLTVVGGTGVEPSYVARVRETAAEAGIAGRIRFTGRLADDAVAERLRAAHVLAVPSRYEPFGMAQLEAMGFGCVPLASAAGGTGEFVTDGESGFLVPPKDPDAVTDRICRLDDRERLAEMAVAARRAYEAWPTWTETLDAAVDFLSEVSSR